ncbi:MAG: GNAT family N-acyltransferase [Alphaproteobacteria bacterium]|nr:GNAT family N-acyltransferase [Alphaproteobacteria bacterium]
MVTRSPGNARVAVSARPSPSHLGSIHVGSTEIRLARGDDDVEAAQELRYRVFYEEMGAVPSPEAAALKLDRDGFDAAAEHILVVDHSRGGAVIGTYRLTRRHVAEMAGGYYTAREFDISKLLEFPGEILELGRSCVDRRFRGRAIMSQLWQGIASYVFDNDIQLLFGCASLPGADPTIHAATLSYLHHHHQAPEAWCPRALGDRYVDMNMLPSDAIQEHCALNQFPPLIKGYLRLGGWVGDGAVIDHQFNTTDVCVVVRMDTLASRYYKHYHRSVHGRRAVHRAVHGTDAT